MKRLVLLFCALLLALLAACRPEPEGSQMEEEPLHLESLSVEVPRSGLSAQDLARTVRELPEALKAALASQGAEVRAVTVSVGSSPSATAQAVAEGGVDLAFLPAADYAALKNPPELILAAGPAAPVLGKDPSAWSGEATGEPLLPGAPALLCAAPTESGAALANKAGDLTWEDLSIHWGAVEDESLQAVGLWLRDRYGETAAHVALSTYEGYEDLLRAAAAGPDARFNRSIICVYPHGTVAFLKESDAKNFCRGRPVGPTTCSLRLVRWAVIFRRGARGVLAHY